MNDKEFEEEEEEEELYFSPLTTPIYHLDAAIKRLKRVQEGVECFWEKDSKILPHNKTGVVRVNLDYALNCMEALLNELNFWRMKDENRKNGKEGYWDSREKREVYDDPEEISKNDEEIRDKLEKVCPNCGKIHKTINSEDEKWRSE